MALSKTKPIFKEIECSILKLSDKISVIFLMCDDSITAISTMKQLLSEESKSEENQIFQKWLTDEEKKNSKWNMKFLEAVSIVQNFKLVDSLGYTKEEVHLKLLPQNIYSSLYISRIKKILYRFCEKLCLNDTKRFIQLVEQENNTVCDNYYKYMFLEYVLLSWSCKNLISINKNTDLNKILKFFKVFELEYLSDELKKAVEGENKVCTPEKSLYDNYYKIYDKNIAGYCIIINEKHFYRTSKPEYLHLLPDTYFESRLGTDADVKRLEETFAKLSFKVITYNNLDYVEFMNILDQYANSIPENHSFFTLIILSHGGENVIYTSDSIPVDIETIEMKFQGHNCPNLINKPKIFIIQSCQGPEWQRIQTDSYQSSKKTDLKNIGPERGDAVIAWSTVKGFASIRDKFSGTWYIQELCKELWKKECNDFVDILLQVNNNLRSRTHEGQVMVPWLSLSVCKKIQFPSHRFRHVAGIKLMLERTLFEKYLFEFLQTTYEEKNLSTFLSSYEM